jgi:CTP:molybdopterin cytidylyltransferase MocA
MLHEAASALPSEQLCNAVYTAIADKPDVKSEHLEKLANRLGRLAHERGRT